jgi:small-conductance mechanosensitive channel
MIRKPNDLPLFNITFNSLQSKKDPEMPNRLQSLLTTILLIFFHFGALAQGETTSKTDAESLKSFLTTDSLFVSNEIPAQKKNEQIGSYLSRIVNNSKNYAIELGKIKVILSEFPDTTELSSQIPELRESLETIKKFTTRDRDRLNLRYLKGVEYMIHSLNMERGKYEKLISKRMDELLEVGKTLEVIRADSTLQFIPRDPTMFPLISKEINIINASINSLDSILIFQELSLTAFQANISEITIELLDLSQFFKQNEITIQRKSWQKEVPFLWGSSDDTLAGTVIEEFISSSRINSFILKRYLREKYIMIGIMALLIAAVFFFIQQILNQISRKKEFADLILERVAYLRKNLFASSIVIVLPLFFLLLHNPPLVFSSILSLILVLFSGAVLRNHFGVRVFTIWIAFLPLYFLGPTIGLHWQVTFSERPIIYLAAVGGILLALFSLKEIGKQPFNGSIVLKYLSIFLLIVSIFSLGANILGRFSLAKSYAIIGVASFYRGLALYLFTQVSLKAVYLWIEARKIESDVISTFFDFQEIQKRIQGLLNLIAFGIWAYSILFYLGFFNPLYDMVSEFLLQERVLGNATFEFSTILLFFVILVISSFLANNIAYFASIQDQKSSHSRTKRLGSSILLIRLAIIIVGFMLAMTAAKIPLDNIAIVLGALSVGIGFGLQTIINNLVSGIILAFEKPIQIGDEIEVGNLSGTVKEVGIRASKIQAYDGSEIILPNGDLLSQSLINWTLSDKRRRIDVTIGVAYDSDMEKVKTLIEKALIHEKILENPHSRVLMQNFGDSSVDFRVLFWVESIDFWIDVRAEIMTAIFESFLENGIEIPFPKRDLYLKSVPSSWKESTIPAAGSQELESEVVPSKTIENKKSSEG